MNEVHSHHLLCFLFEIWVQDYVSRVDEEVAIDEETDFWEQDQLEIWKHGAYCFLTERYLKEMAGSSGSDFVGSSGGSFGGSFEGRNEGISRSSSACGFACGSTFSSAFSFAYPPLLTSLSTRHDGACMLYVVCCNIGKVDASRKENSLRIKYLRVLYLSPYVLAAGKRENVGMSFPRMSASVFSSCLHPLY